MPTRIAPEEEVTSSEYESEIEFESEEEESQQPEQKLDKPVRNAKATKPPQNETEQQKIDRRRETSRLNLAKARERKKELASLRALEKAKTVMTKHLVKEEDSEDESESESESEEELVLTKQPKKGLKKLIEKSSKKVKETEKRRRKLKEDDDRITRLEKLLAAQLEHATKTAKKQTRKPRTKTSVIKIEQPLPKVNEKYQKQAEKMLLDLGL